MKISKHDFPWLYVIISYGLSWVIWIPIARTGQNYQQSPLLLMLMFLGVFAPGIAGIIIRIAWTLPSNKYRQVESVHSEDPHVTSSCN